MNGHDENLNKELKIIINTNNEITGYATIGGIEGEISIPYEKVPADFIENFDSKYYLYVDGQVKENENYEPPQVEQRSGVSELESLKLLAMQQSAQIAELQSK
ncbi:DUF2977 domain-containing protein [Mammaliicoccus sciuri]|uniref:DUF2977 domain-containing protein n=1 Tax=Mammaliicoccus sciuri TaxID=1296 RepID=UPI00336528D8